MEGDKVPQITWKCSFKEAFHLFTAPVDGHEILPPPYNGLWSGYVSYNALRHFEKIDLSQEELFYVPDFFFTFSDTFIIEDHLNGELSLVLLDTNLSTHSVEEREKAVADELSSVSQKGVYPEEIEENVEIKSHITRSEYLERIRTIQDYIRAGDVYQVNFTYPLSMECTLPSPELFTRYLHKNPVDFSAYLNLDHLEILSISPECFFTLHNNKVRSYPIKGTIGRGKTKEQDTLLRKQLINSEKDRAELSMIVDLIRNDIGKVAELGSVKVKQHASIETFHTLHHLYSLIEGRLGEKSRTELFASMFPGGSITGAPKVRSMELIAELERYKRNVYTGSIGWIGYGTDISLNIAIRTVQRMKNTLYYFVGGGITLDSNPDAEYEETLTKARSFHNIFKKATFSHV